jgi:hypothetical protein
VALAEEAHGAQHNRAAAAEDEDGRRGTGGDADDQVDQLARGGGELMRQILARAAARGQAREQIPERVARLPLDLIRHELILTHRAPTSKTLEEIVDEIFLPLVQPAG